MASNQRGNYNQEVKDSMSNPTKRPSQIKKESKADKAADTPAELARDKAKGIVEGSAKDEGMDVMPMHNSGNGHGNLVGGTSPPPHHVAMAASIAHAILGNRGS